MSKEPQPYEQARPRKRRSHPYRLPLGAFCCILIWFFAVFLNGNSEDKPEKALTWENFPQATAASNPFKVYDFKSDLQDVEELDKEIANAIQYYSLVSRKSKKPVAEAHILLPDSFSYQSFLQLVKVSQEENLQLAVGMDKRLIVKALD